MKAICYDTNQFRDHKQRQADAEAKRARRKNGVPHNPPPKMPTHYHMRYNPQNNPKPFKMRDGRWYEFDRRGCLRGLEQPA